jgi:hypothetical protein
LSLEIVTSLSEQQKSVRTDAMVYNELTDVDATPAPAAARGRLSIRAMAVVWQL